MKRLLCLLGIHSFGSRGWRQPATHRNGQLVVVQYQECRRCFKRRVLINTMTRLKWSEGTWQDSDREVGIVSDKHPILRPDGTAT